MSAAGDAASRPLVAIVSDEIRRDGPIDFARFMELALYHPRHGYYTSGAGRLGPAGDFVTASDAGPHFGRALARRLAAIDRVLGRCDPFDVVEWGAGRGWLARDVTAAVDERAPELGRRLRYRAVDRSPAMRAEARRAAPGCEVVAPEALRAGAACGVAVAVELFDALPVRRLRRTSAGVVEVRVGLDAAGRLTEVETPSPPGLADEGARGGEWEVAPGLPSVVAAMHAPFARGVSIVVDYGDTAERLRRAFPRGTLLAYHRHTVHERLLERPGRQDMTAHVDFTALERAAVASGWTPLGNVSQERFLVANGILEAFEAPDDARWRDPRQVAARQQALRLLHPAGMGRTFRVVSFGRGVERLPEDGDGGPLYSGR